MKPIDINLASSPFRNDKPVWAVLGLAAAFAFGFTGYNTWAFLSAGSRQARLEQEIAGHRKRMHEMKLEADKLQAALAKVDQETLSSQAEFVSSILVQRNFSWTHLFNALEAVTPWDVKLVSIRPQFELLDRRTGVGRIRIAISGVGRSFESFLDLQDALQAAEMFSEVTPEEYQRQGDDRVDFNMAFTYKPPEAPVEGAGAEGVAAAEADSSGETAEAGPVMEAGPADAAAVDEGPAPEAPAGSAAPPPSAARTPRAASTTGGATTGSESPAARPAVADPSKVETDEIDGKPVLKPRINPNREVESGYRRRQTPPPPADPAAGGDR